jgi:signal peptidase I
MSIPTGSMNPAIKPGSLVLVHSVSTPSLKVGDIITYTNPRNQKETVTHRIAQTYQISDTVPAFVTKGDANPSADPPIVSGMVKGRVETITPYLGTAINWLKTLPGLIAIIYIPALFVIIEEIRRLTKYYKSLLPYMAAGYSHSFTETPRGRYPVRTAAAALLVPAAFVTAVAVPAHALLKSNTVSLSPNTLSVAAVTPPNNCSGNTTNSTNVNVTNTSNQTATTGNANNTNNTTGGSATSGSASNNNSTNININVNSCP